MIKRKSHGVAHSRKGVIPAQRVAIHRNRSKSSPTEILLIILLISVFVFISGAYIYHFTAEPSPDSYTIPLAPFENVKPVKVVRPVKIDKQPRHQRVIRGKQIETAQEKNPLIPPLPPFATIPNAERLMEDTYHGKPTIAGVISILPLLFHNIMATTNPNFGL